MIKTVVTLNGSERRIKSSKTQAGILTCFLCGSSIGILNSIKGRKALGFKQLNPGLPETKIKWIPIVKTGRACKLCAPKLDQVLFDEWDDNGG